MKLAWSQQDRIRRTLGVSSTTAAQRGNFNIKGHRMLSVQSCSGMNMAGSAPALSGFGSSGKSFLIDNLLQAQTQTPLWLNGPKRSHLRPTAREQLGSSWAADFALYQSQAHRKDLGGPPPVPHSAGKGTTFNLTASREKKDNLG